MTLGFDEKRVLALIKGRLALGQSEYGLLDIRKGKRDFKKETLEEILDATIYLAILILKLSNKDFDQ